MSLLVVSGGAGVYLYVLDRSIPRFDLEKPVPGQSSRPDAAPGRALNFLLVGSDTREGASAADLERFGTEFEGGGRRSDTIILLHLSGDRKKSALVSFPRDSYVDIPGHGPGKINTAYGKGPTAADGARVLRATIEQLTGLRIDHYIEVNFGGFLKMVDALDGVPVCLREPAVDPKAGLDLPAGRQTVRGTQALGFVRTRSIDGRVDFGRIERQQQFLAATLNKATSLGMLTNLPKLNGFLQATAGALTFDDRLKVGTITDLALSLKGLDPGKVTFLTAPVADPGLRVGGQLAVKLDDVAGRALWEAIRRDGPLPGAVPPQAGSTASPLAVAPSGIRVRVLNGTGERGVARRAAGDLERLGFTVVGTGDADDKTYTSTVVRHGVDRAESARTLSAALEGAGVQVDATLGRTLEVVIGADYDGAVPVTVPTPRARTGIAPAPFEQRTAADDPCA
jgi:LCP family protein required for cell wall assembly